MNKYAHKAYLATHWDKTATDSMVQPCDCVCVCEWTGWTVYIRHTNSRSRPRESESDESVYDSVCGNVNVDTCAVTEKGSIVLIVRCV